MTGTEPDTFPLGYFYVISKFNGLALDIDKTEPIQVSVYIVKEGNVTNTFLKKAGSKVVTAVKIEEKIDRDSQLWIHQNGTSSFVR